MKVWIFSKQALQRLATPRLFRYVHAHAKWFSKLSTLHLHFTHMRFGEPSSYVVQSYIQPSAYPWC